MIRIFLIYVLIEILYDNLKRESMNNSKIEGF